MGTKKEDRNLQELFRHKLENAEIIPAPSLEVKLMRKLAIMEFMHFNPLMFNAYYLGGLIVAAVATIVILTAAPHRNEKKPYEKIRNGLPDKENFEVPKSAAPQVIDNKPSGRSQSKKKETVIQQHDGRKSANVKINPPAAGLINKSSAPAGTINKSLKEKNLFNISGSNKSQLRERLPQGKSISIASVSEGCAPLKVQFKNWLAAYDSCIWNFGDGGSSNSKDPEWIYDVEGEYNADLNVYGPVGLIATFSAVISVHPKPAARFEILPEKAVIPDDPIRFQNYSSEAVRYFWSFGDGNTSEQYEPVHKYTKYGKYSVALKVSSEYGCSDSLVVSNAFSGSAFYIDLPNAFIPNPDGPSGGAYSAKSDESAQVFHPSWSGVSEYQLKIFSKMGVLLFETRDLNIGWDGYYKGQLSNTGVYIWKVRGNFSNGESFTKMGDLTLLKK